MYERFRQSFANDPVISVSEIKKVYPNFDTRNLVNWQKKGYVVRLRNGFYTFAAQANTEQDLFVVANRLYEPSYVSLESALSWHGVIPEGVYSVESVATRKTNCFNTPIARFNYRTIKADLFFGYALVPSEKGPFRMATLEKAILDFFYLNPNVVSTTDLQALRWSLVAISQVDFQQLADFAKLFNAPKIDAQIQLLKTYLDG